MKMDRFKCWGVSENMNSFGLREARLLSREGHFWTVCANDLNVPEDGDEIVVPMTDGGEPKFETLGYEIPERQHPDAPPEVIAQVWNR